jgi:TolA-binding protein
VEREPVDFKIVERGRMPVRSLSSSLAIYSLVVLAVTAGLSIAMIEWRKINEISHISIELRKQVDSLNERIDGLEERLRTLRDIVELNQSESLEKKAVPREARTGPRN